MNRIGIFGGSFNPIHLGHTALAAYICEQRLVDEVWLMVSPLNPLKKNIELLDEQHRLAMAQLAVSPYPMLHACDFEFHLPRPSYTYNTLQALHTAHSDCQFSLIIGQDNWEHFDHWYRSEDILRETPIIVYPRNEQQAQVPHLHITHYNNGNEVHLLCPHLFPYSSTEIRQRIANNSNVNHMLHPDVATYIEEHHLYTPNTPHL